MGPMWTNQRGQQRAVSSSRKLAHTNKSAATFCSSAICTVCTLESVIAQPRQKVRSGGSHSALICASCLQLSYSTAHKKAAQNTEERTPRTNLYTQPSPVLSCLHIVNPACDASFSIERVKAHTHTHKRVMRSAADCVDILTGP